MMEPSLRHKTWAMFNVGEGGTWGRLVDRTILFLIIGSAVGLTLESVESVNDRYGRWLQWFDILTIVVFSVEYIARLWSCTVDFRYEGLTGRVKFALRPLMLLDLLAILPFFLGLAFDLRMLRMLRLMRILRILKATKYSQGMAMIGRVLKAKREELMMSTSLMLFMVFIASCVLYQFERQAQPEAFGSIPSAAWWAVVTLTTIGYGDVYPVTAGGKIVTAMFALIAIGMVALPTGIISSGYVDEIARTKKKPVCPHCGEDLD